MAIEKGISKAPEGIDVELPEEMPSRTSKSRLLTQIWLLWTTAA